MRQIDARPTRAELAYEAIRDSICDGVLEPGMHLVQEDLALRLGVSRQPVQQAMVLLKNAGLVRERGSRGLFVAPIDARSAIHRYQIRTVLDRLAARLVAQRAGTDRLFAEDFRTEALRIMADGEAAVAEGRYREAVRHDVEFHSLIYRMSGNPFLPSTAEQHWNYLRRVMVAVLVYADRGETVWRQHREILELLTRGEVEAAVEAVTVHVSGAEEALLARIADGALVPED